MRCSGKQSNETPKKKPVTSSAFYLPQIPGNGPTRDLRARNVAAKGGGAHKYPERTHAPHAASRAGRI